MSINNVELVINDLYSNIVEYNADEVYHQLYEGYDKKLKTIFVYFHSEFNRLFSFMNEKIDTTKHFNAQESRELINIILEFKDFCKALSGSEKEINVENKYLLAIEACGCFLDRSGGSTIPDDFSLIEIIKYEPIFSICNRVKKINEDIYNLLISCDEDAWESNSFKLDRSRFLEYTDQDVKEKFTTLGTAEIDSIKNYPCIFAYEDVCKKDARIGYITDIMVRRDKIKITFQKGNVLSLENLHALTFELDIRDLELNRTHWAIKRVNLNKELQVLGIRVITPTKSTCFDKKIFDVAFTFAGETRNLVEEVLKELEKTINKDDIFYDNNYISQLAVPALDVLLKDIYGKRSKLVVVFLCAKYQDKEWCGIEFGAIRDTLMKKDNTQIMYIKLDNGLVNGVLKTDGYIDGTKYSPAELANFIKQRVDNFNTNNS